MHPIETKSLLSPKGNMNLTRGCVHGCIYCDSRSDCYQMDHGFSDVAIKKNAISRLSEVLRHRRKKGMIGCGAMSDPYQPIPEVLALTRESIETVNRYGFGMTLITKSDLVLRDLDRISDLNQKTRFVLQMTLTCMDDELSRKIEPHVCPTSRRIEVLRQFRDAGVPTVVWLTPVLPFLTDTRENLEGILGACLEAEVSGILWFGAGVTLRSGNREYFYQELDRSFPGMKERYMRAFGESYVCSSPNHRDLDALVRSFCQKHQILYRPEEIFSWLREFPESKNEEQLTFF